MRFTIKFIKTIVVASATLVSLLAYQQCFADSENQNYLNIFGATKNLTAGQLQEPYASIFPQNNINGWNPNECIGGNTTGICGDTVKEKYWSTLRQKFDEVHVAAIMGNTAHEGSSPVAYETGHIIDGNGNFLIGWDSLYNNCNDVVCGGVGAFQFTSGLSNYLHFVNEKNPNLIKYFKEPGYGHISGDELLEKIGENDFHALMEIELEWMYKELEEETIFSLEHFLSINQAGEAASYWANKYERCAACGYNWGDSQLYARASEAEKIYDEMKGFTCSGSSSSSSHSVSSSSSSNSSSVSEDGSNVTIIGDSITSAAQDAILNKLPQADIHAKDCKTVGADVNIHCGGADPPNESGLNIVKNLRSKNTLRDKVVFALGTNGSGFDKLQEAINEIGPDRQIYLMTLFETTDDHSGQNAIINQLVKDNDNVDVFDWANAVSSNPGILTDGTHPNAEGSEIFANLIYDVVSKAHCTTYEGDYPQYTQETDHTCGPASMAMLATVAAGQDVTEADVIKIIGDDNAYVNTVGSGMVSLDQKVGEEYGFTVEQVDVNEGDKGDVAAKMKEYLNNGYMIHMSGCGSTISPTGGCHYTGMFSINGDKVMLADSAGNAFSNREVDLADYVSSGYHGNAFSAIKVGGTKNTCDSDRCNEGGSGSYSGGFKSLEEADKVIMDPYRDFAANNPGEWGAYNITAGTPYNCFSFSNYFITKYTTIDFSGVPGVDGGAYATAFYEQYHDSYPDLVISDKPTPYSVAGCGDASYTGGNYSHTFIVLGVDEAKDTMIYGEASYGAGPSGIIANEISLSDTSWGSRNGSTGICHYTNFSKYLKGL